MRLVLLTGTGPEHRYLAGRLATAFPDSLVAIILATPPPRSLRARIRGYVRRYTLPQLLSRVEAKLFTRLTGASQRRTTTLERILFPQGDDHTMPRSELVRTVPSHNSEACLALLAGLGPDVIAVYGTSVIKAPVIRAARCGVINMHTGISPRYRGSDTIFWALHNQEPKWVGVTVHLLDEGIDSGPILATGRPEISVDDDENTLFGKTVIVGAGLYIDAVSAVAEGRANALPQDSRDGREYRFVDRTVAAEWRVRRLLAGGLLRRHVEGRG